MIHVHVLRKLERLNHVSCIIRGFGNVIKDTNQNKLIGRLFNYINQDNKVFPNISIFNNNITNSVMLGIKANNFEPSLKDAHVNKPTLSDSEIIRNLTLFDKKCSSYVNKMDTTDIITILGLYMQLVPNRIINYEFYKFALDHLVDHLEFLSVMEKLQLMFFAGLQKKTKNAQKLLKRCMKSLSNKDIENLSTEDLCIICNSTFKTSTKITNTQLLDIIINTLNTKLYLLKDPALFITLIKSIRHNRYQNDDILSTISSTVLFNATYQFYTFGAMCHILAAYADYLYYDDCILKLFNENCIQLLRDSKLVPRKIHVNEKIRAKDIKRFLWIYSYLGYKLDKKSISDVIIPNILSRIKNGDYNEEPESLLDSILYLWMLKYQALELIPYCFTEKNIEVIKESKTKSKFRLNLLLTVIQLENLPLFKEINFKPQSYHHINVQQQVSYRPYLQRVYNAFKVILPKLEINKIEFECQIPHLNIVGITAYKKSIYKSVFVEVLDDYVCVKNLSSFAFGPMQLKLRLLDDMDQALIIMESQEIKEMSDDKLQEYLESEINLVC